MYCVRCGTKNEDGYKYCYKCGSELPSTSGESISFKEDVKPVSKGTNPLMSEWMRASAVFIAFFIIIAILFPVFADKLYKSSYVCAWCGNRVNEVYYDHTDMYNEELFMCKNCAREYYGGLYEQFKVDDDLLRAIDKRQNSTSSTSSDNEAFANTNNSDLPNEGRESAVAPKIVETMTNDRDRESVKHDLIPVDLEIGGTILFGRYEQDGNSKNGAEPIEWIVLMIGEDRALLLSRYVLDNVKYNEVLSDTTWESCSLRSWLNTAFYNTAFNREERELVILSTNRNEDNPNSKTIGGVDTQDHVFILDYSDLRAYFNFSKWNDKTYDGYSQQLITDATVYAKSANGGTLSTKTMTREEYYKIYQGYGYNKDIIGKSGSRWWTRTPGVKQDYACDVDEFGNAGLYDNRKGAGDSYAVNSDFIGVRPAIWVRIV